MILCALPIRVLVAVPLGRFGRHAGDLRVSVCCLHPRPLSGGRGAHLLHGERQIQADVLPLQVQRDVTCWRC